MIDRVKNEGGMILACLFGSLVAIYYTRPLCWKKAFVCWLGGLGSALFLAPALAHFLGVSAAPIVNALGFLTGTFSMSVFGALFQIVDRIRQAPIKTLGAFADIAIDVLLAFRGGDRDRRKDDRKRDEAEDEENGKEDSSDGD